MADLSFIEDSVAFPEKEEDEEEEEEEGVEWGYEEGNRPRVRRLVPRDPGGAGAGASPFPRGSSRFSHGPGPFRGSGRCARRLRSRRGARPFCQAAVGTCRRPEGEPEGCGGDISVRGVAEKSSITLCSTS